MDRETTHQTDRRFGLSTLEWMLLAVIAIGAAFMLRMLVAPPSDGPTKLLETLSHLEYQVRELSSRLDALCSDPTDGNREPPSATGKAPIEFRTDCMRELESRLQTLEREMAALKARVSAHPAWGKP